MKQILILGGGAAGMAAAIAAAQNAPQGTQVVVLEKNPRVGKKLLATGNGRCNLDHTPVTEEDFFTSDSARLQEMLRAMEDNAPLKWFEAHGLLHRTDEAGRVYPYSNQAADVLNLLLYWLNKTGVQVRTDCTVMGLSKTEEGFVAELSDGRQVEGQRVICALGGSASPQFGSDGAGVQLVRPFGCKSTKLYPCLTPLRCRKEEIAGLSGIRVKAAAALYDGETCIHRELGEIQFTEYGLSGIAVMQLSGHLGQQRKLRHPEIRLDLFPEQEASQLGHYLKQRSQLLSGADMGQFMTGLVHRRVGSTVWSTLNLGAESRHSDTLSEAEWERLAQGLKTWRFTQPEDTGWKQAQTTGGGVRLSDLETDSFQVIKCPGLYVVGETTDSAGSCGGFNLHWAFGSGILAGLHAAKAVE